MTTENHFDVIIIGGSYAGLSAAMALGRSLRKVLIIDSGMPCNRQTPHSHNFVTQDGVPPHVIAAKAKEQVLQYKTVKFHSDLATEGLRTETGFTINTQSGATFTAEKLLFATGIKDIMPDIDGFASCWGISVIHCPYCHGYEVSNEKTTLLANSDIAFEKGKMISNWTKDLTILTNGPATFTTEQKALLQANNINILESEIDHIQHTNGQIEKVIFKDNSEFGLKAMYAHVDFKQHSDIPETLGCELTEQGYLQVNMMQKTTVDGVYACGDNTSPMRSVAMAVYTGSFAGAAINKELIEERFGKEVSA